MMIRLGKFLRGLRRSPVFICVFWQKTRISVGLKSIRLNDLTFNLRLMLYMSTRVVLSRNEKLIRNMKLRIVTKLFDF